MKKGGCIYIMTNQYHTTLYIGVTSDLIIRVQQHKNKEDKKSFTARYNLNKLIYYETFLYIEEAILREKQIKKWSRAKKEQLISSGNSDWNDLWDCEVRFW
ncbi:MAG: GIY-YIG nuclease family protein [Sediminibacterium sp.]|jgi:putative endonuclease|uniref:GIY-YIG nuclease family protein n=1 Tax=Sediminibacterium sp. TaxID=1917865 RepID=UPI001DC2850A|nr:GIY-YIG nuclease family protein [Sediminibacterium sp.]MBW0163588.1 GIY-YIG nuclease family protein [Sediminibacterium sp.]